MLAVLLEQDHRQQAGARPSPWAITWNGAGAWAMLLAVAARELLAHRLDHLPLAGNDLQRLGDVLAQLRQARAATAGQAVGPGTTTRSRGRCSGNGLRAGRLRVKAATLVVLATAFSAASSSSVAEALQLLELQLQLIEQAGAAFGALAEAIAVELLDLQLR